MKMVSKQLTAKGYEYKPSQLNVLTFHSAVRIGDLIFTSGQIPILGDTQIKGVVGETVDLPTAQKAAEICAFNCLCAAGAVVDINKIKRVVKILGLVNAADSFDQMSEVINGATVFFTDVFGDAGFHARSAVGAKLPSNWAVEVEAIFAV